MTIFYEPLIMVTRSNYGVYYVCHVHQYCVTWNECQCIDWSSFWIWKVYFSTKQMCDKMQLEGKLAITDLL